MLNFIKEYGSLTFQPREDVMVNLTDSEIQSGDTFCVLKTRGIAILVVTQTGSRCEHTAIAVRDNGQLYVMESTDDDQVRITIIAGMSLPHLTSRLLLPCRAQDPNDVGDHFGIQRFTWSRWISDYRSHDYVVVMMRLRPDLRATFDEETANAFFRRMENGPFGYENFLYTALEWVYRIPFLFTLGIEMILWLCIAQHRRHGH